MEEDILKDAGAAGEEETEEAADASGERHPTPLRAIRRKCLDCCGMSPNEVRLCDLETCPLHPFRLGRPAWRKKREISEETRQKLIEQLRRARKGQGRA